MAPQKLNRDYVVDVFEAALADPHKPAHCAQCIAGCILTLFHPSTPISIYDELRVDRPGFFDVAARFITVPRPDEENTRLQEEMAVCHCDLSDKRLRSLHGVATPGTHDYKSLGHMVASQVHNVLQPVRDEAKLHKVEKNQRRAARHGKSVPWPRSPQDVLPYGVNDSIAALGVWVEISTAGPLWLGLFASILELFKKEVVLPILASPTLPGKFVGIAEIPFIVFAYNESASNDTRISQEVAADLKRAAVLYKMIVNYFDQDETRVLFQKANEQFAEEDPGRNFLHVCKIALELLPSLGQIFHPASTSALDVQHAMQDFLLSGVMFHNYLDLPFDVEKYGQTIVDRARQLKDVEQIAANAAFQGFLRLWLSDRCWSPGCRETFAGAGRSFAACSRCRRFTYCSKDCLAKAWKHEDVPHRTICKTVKYIAEATNLSPKPEAEEIQTFQVFCVLKKVDNSALEDFSSHMAKLQKYMSLVPFEQEGTWTPFSWLAVLTGLYR